MKLPRVSVVVSFLILGIGLVAELTAQEPLKLSDNEIEADFGKVSNADKSELDTLLEKYTVESNVPVPMRLDMRATVSRRLQALGDTTHAIEVLRPVVSMDLPAETDQANFFAQSWLPAVTYLRGIMHDAEMSSELFKELSAVRERPCCFAQQIAYSTSLQFESEYVSGVKIDEDLVHTEFERLRQAFPEQPHYIALLMYTNYIKSVQEFEPYVNRLSAIDLIRKSAMTAIESESEPEIKGWYFRVLRPASSQRAAMSIRESDQDASIILAQLANEIDNYADYLAALPQDNPKFAEATKSFYAKQKKGFRDDITKAADSAKLRVETNLMVYDSLLLGKPAPKFDGEFIQQTTSNKANSSPVYLLDFWMTSCGPCIKRFPELTDLHKKYEADGLQIIGVLPLPSVRWSQKEDYLVSDAKSTHSERLEAIQNLLKKYEVNYSQVADDGSIASAFGVYSFPTYVLVGRDGLVKLVAGGGDETFEVLKRAIREELAKE